MRRLIKTFEFSEDERQRITLDAGARLDPKTNRIELKPLAGGLYAVSPAGASVSTPVFNPETARQWLGFQSLELHPRADDGQRHTSIRYRISDGTTEYHWDGAAWTASTTLWNTEAEVSAGLPTFPAESQKLRVIANLVTDDRRYSPALMAVKIAYATDIAFHEDLIYRSLVSAIRTNVRPMTDWPVKLTTAGTTFTLNATNGPFRLDNPYNIASVHGAYNHDADPTHVHNLLQSYNPTTKQLTLSSSVPAGATLWITFYFEPEVMVHTSRDYIELGKVPAVVVSDINISRTAETGKDDFIVTNKTTGAAIKVPGPKMHDFDFSVRFLTEKARDLQRMQEAVRTWIRTNPLLRARGIDERYSMTVLNHYDSQGVAADSEVHAGRIRLRINNALFYDRPDEDAFATVRFTLRGPPDLIVS